MGCHMNNTEPWATEFGFGSAQMANNVRLCVRTSRGGFQMMRPVREASPD